MALSNGLYSMSKNEAIRLVMAELAVDDEAEARFIVELALGERDGDVVVLGDASAERKWAMGIGLPIEEALRVLAERTQSADQDEIDRRAARADGLGRLAPTRSEHLSAN